MSLHNIVSNTHRFFLLLFWSVFIAGLFAGNAHADKYYSDNWDEDIKTDVSKDIVYKGEDVTITFDDASGQDVVAYTLTVYKRLKNGKYGTEEIGGTGNSVTLTYEQLAGGRIPEHLGTKWEYDCTLLTRGGDKSKRSKVTFEVVVSSIPRPADSETGQDGTGEGSGQDDGGSGGGTGIDGDGDKDGDGVKNSEDNDDGMDFDGDGSDAESPIPIEKPVPKPKVKITGVQPVGDVKNLTYQFTASHDGDGLKFTQLIWSVDSISGPKKPGSGVVKFPESKEYVIRVNAEFIDPTGETPPVYAEDARFFFAGENLPPIAKLEISNADPPATYTKDEAKGRSPVKVTFSAKGSIDPEGEKLKYYWYSSDSSKPMETTTPSAVREFKNVGTYTVYVIVEDESGIKSEKSNLVTVIVQEGDEVLNHTHNPKGPAFDTIDFDMLIPQYNAAKSVLYDWDFGDNSGIIRGSNKARISHTYMAEGKYTVKVTYTYYLEGGQENYSLTKEIEVKGPIKAELSAGPQLVMPGKSPPPLDKIPYDMQMRFYGENISTPYGKAKYKFDLDGDGKFEHVMDKPSINHKCTTPGTFEALLRVEDDQGNHAETTLKYTVLPGLTAVLNVWPPTGIPPAKITCDASGSTNQAGSVDYYIWDISQVGGGGTSDKTTDSIIVVDFPDPGVYIISVKACDNLHNESTPVEERVVVGSEPVAKIGFSKPVYMGTSVTFSAASSTSPNGAIKYYEWDMNGQGFASDKGADLVDQGPSLTATYAQFGSKTVRLKVTDVLGFSKVTSETFEVIVMPPPQDDPFHFGTKVPIK